MQLLVSLAIVVISTLYAKWRCADNCADGQDFASGWWILNDSGAITTLGDIIFILTVVASFLISFDSYINAKAQSQPLAIVLNADGGKVLASAHPRVGPLLFRCPCATELPLMPFMLAAGALAAAAILRGHTQIDHLGVSHARCAVWGSLQ